MAASASRAKVEIEREARKPFLGLCSAAAMATASGPRAATAKKADDFKAFSSCGARAERFASKRAGANRVASALRLPRDRARPETVSFVDKNRIFCATFGYPNNCLLN
jgi:hypothetical protein